MSSEFQPYAYRSRLPRVSVLTSLVDIGLDPNTDSSQRDLILGLISDESSYAKQRGLLGHTVHAARVAIEEMAIDIAELQNPPFELPEIIEPEPLQ